eukprot:7380736-Prymnesium_polylepis.1
MHAGCCRYHGSSSSSVAALACSSFAGGGGGNVCDGPDSSDAAFVFFRGGLLPALSSASSAVLISSSRTLTASPSLSLRSSSFSTSSRATIRAASCESSRTSRPCLRHLRSVSVSRPADPPAATRTVTATSLVILNSLTPDSSSGIHSSTAESSDHSSGPAAANENEREERDDRHPAHVTVLCCAKGRVKKERELCVPIFGIKRDPGSYRQVQAAAGHALPVGSEHAHSELAAAAHEAGAAAR